MSNADFITSQQFADLLGCSTRCITEMAKRGDTPPFTWLGRRRAWLRLEVEEWLLYGAPSRALYEQIRDGRAEPPVRLRPVEGASRPPGRPSVVSKFVAAH